MDHSTNNVTLAAAFVNDVLDIYKQKSATDYEILKKMTIGLDLSNPMNMVPMEVYNSMCNWIESQVGQANAKLVGRQIGRTAYEAMKSFKMINDKSTPLEVMNALVTVASTMIKDPKGRGWVILESHPKTIVMRRTQTFNGTLQFGLLDEIIRKTGVLSPKIEYLRNVANCNEFDEYKITWL
jgi:hypothetical protein